jgi:hypothetical protein
VTVSSNSAAPGTPPKGLGSIVILNSEIETTKGTKDHKKQESWCKHLPNPNGEAVHARNSLIFEPFRDFGGFHLPSSVHTRRQLEANRDTANDAMATISPCDGT